MPGVTTAPPPPRVRTAVTVLILLWALVFVLGAAGELLDIEFLRRITDFKRIFLQ
jgi:hypothetical protein